MTSKLEEAAARQVIAEVARDLPKFRTNEDSVGAEFQLAFAHGIIGNEDTGCRIIKRIATRAETTRYAEQVSSFIAKSTCP